MFDWWDCPYLVARGWRWQPHPRLGLSQELSSGLQSARTPAEHLTRQLLSWTEFQEGKHSPEAHSVGQDRHLLSLLWLSPVKDSISNRYCQGSGLERGSRVCVGQPGCSSALAKGPGWRGCFEGFVAAPHAVRAAFPTLSPSPSQGRDLPGPHGEIWSPHAVALLEMTSSSVCLGLGELFPQRLAALSTTRS